MTDLNPTTQAAYRAAAQASWHRDGEIEIDDDAKISRGSDHGAYVQAWVWVANDDLEPGPGFSYDVWIAEPDDDARFSEPWRFDQRFTSEDDSDGKSARRSAHDYARQLRQTYPCSYVAVRQAGQPPLSLDNHQ
jgi:hypothetical protein